MARFNFKFATAALLTALALGGAGYGAYWWSQRKSPDRFEAEGDREVARAEAFLKANDQAQADAAYIAAGNAYGRALQLDITRRSTLEKFRNLTISLHSPNTEDATAWLLQHLIARRHEAKASDSPHAWRDFYEGMVRLASEGSHSLLLLRTRQVAHERLDADSRDADARLYRGVCDHLLFAMVTPAGWEVNQSLPKDLQALCATLRKEAREDLEAVRKDAPSHPVAAAHLALMRVRDIRSLPEKERSGDAAKRLAKEARAILAPALAANPGDVPLAVAAARVAYAIAPLTGAPADADARAAMRLALAAPDALDAADVRELCLVACHALPAPVRDGADGAHTEGQRAALALAKAKLARHAGALERSTLGWVQSFAGAHADAIATLEAGIAASDGLSVPDRLAYECRKPEMLFLLAHTQLNQAILKAGADRDALIAGARKTKERLELLEDPQLAARILLVEAQLLYLENRHEEAAGRFDRALRLSPFLASPQLLRTAAMCHTRCGNLGASAELLGAALRLDPLDAGSHRMIAFNLLQMGAAEQAIAPHLAYTDPGSSLSGDLALRGGRFWEAAEAYGAVDPLATLQKRAQALRALGRAEQARQEIIAFLRAGKPTAKRALLACRALEEQDREPVLLAMQKELGLPADEAEKVREALAKPTREDDPAAGLSAVLSKAGKDALAAFAKRDFAAFESLVRQKPEDGGEPCLEHPDILSRRIELAILKRDWDGAGKLCDRAEQLRLDLPLGGSAAVRATLAAMRALETGSPSPAEAQKQLKEVADESPASARLWMLLANLCLADGHASQAAQAAAYACRLQPHRTDCHQMLFQCRLRLGDAGLALADLRDAAKEHPFNDELRELWLTSEEAVGDARAVEAARVLRAQTTPEDLHNALRLSGLFVRDGRTGDARALLLGAAPRAAGNPQVAMQLALALCRAGFPDDGRAAYRHLLGDKAPPAFVALGLAQLEAVAGDGASETAAWQTALNLEPTDTRPVSQAYAGHLLASGKAQDAATFLANLLPHAAEASALRAGVQSSLAEALTRCGRFDEAAATAAAMPQRTAAVVRANIAIAKGDDVDALRFARQAAALDPDAVGALVTLGHALSCDPLREVEARDAVRRALEAAPTHAGARHLEAMLDAQSGRYRLAINRLWRNLAINPEHLPSFRLLTELLFQENEERAVLSAAVANLQGHPDEVGYLRTASRAALERFRGARLAGRPTDARLAAGWATGFQSQAFARSDAPVDSLSLLGILVETGRSREALEMLGRLTLDNRTQPPLLAMRALILSRGARAPEADAAFAQALRACRDADETMECLRLCAQAATPARALALARETLGDARPPFARISLAVMAMRWSLPQEVRAELTPVLAGPDFAALPAPQRARVLGTLGAAENMLDLPKEAAAHYRAAAALLPDDIVIQNNLADLLLRHPELAAGPDEAMDAARRASFIAARAAAQGRIPRRELAAIRDTLATALAARGRKEEATTIYRSVLDIFPIPESHLHLGLLLDEAKQAAPAKQHYEAAAKLADQTGQKELAAEARWRAAPALFATNLGYAETLAALRPEKARAMAAACAALAKLETPPAPALARLMSLCATLWPQAKAGEAVPEGWQTALDLATRAVGTHPDAPDYLLLRAVALQGASQSAGNPDGEWDAALDRALTLWSKGAARWRAPMPRALPLPDINTRAATLQLPPTPWPLSRENMREIHELLAAAPQDSVVRRIADILTAQQAGNHAAVADLVGALTGPPPGAAGSPRSHAEPGPTLRRLLATSFMALERWEDAAAALEPLAGAQGTAGKAATPADRIRLLGLFVRLKRPEAQTRALADRILAEDPRTHAAREFLGDLAMADKDHATAAAQYAAIAPQDLPAAPAACVKRAEALAALGRRTEANAVLEDGRDICPSDPWILDAFLAAAPRAEDRERAFRDACGKGLDPDLALAFAKQWGFTLKVQNTQAADPAKEKPAGAPAETSASPAPQP